MMPPLFNLFWCLPALKTRNSACSVNINKSPPFDTVPAPSDCSPFSPTLISGYLQ